MPRRRYTINIPENMQRGTILIVNITLDTKEIKGGREEVVLKPAWPYKIETFKHSGKMKIDKEYKLSDRITHHSVPLRKKRFLKAHKLPKLTKLPKLPKLPEQPELPELPKLTGLGDLTSLGENTVKSLFLLT